jgi:hypothetical protein
MGGSFPRNGHRAHPHAPDEDDAPTCRSDGVTTLRRPTHLGAQVVLSACGPAFFNPGPCKCAPNQQHPAAVPEVLDRADSAPTTVTGEAAPASSKASGGFGGVAASALKFTKIAPLAGCATMNLGKMSSSHLTYDRCRGALTVREVVT